MVSGRVEDGMNELARAERMAPKSEVINRERARAFLQIGRSDLAVAELRKGIAKAPNSLAMKRALARLLLRLRHTRDAIELFASVHEADPGNTRDALNLAGAYATAGRLDDAEKLATAMLNKSQETLQARTVLVGIYRKRGQVTDAAAQLVKMIETNPRHSPGYELVVLRIAQGRYKEAVALLEKLFEANKDAKLQPRQLARLAVAQAASGETMKAAEALAAMKSVADEATEEGARRQLRRIHAVQSVAVYAALGRMRDAAEAHRRARALKAPLPVLTELQRLLRDCRARPEKATKIATTTSKALILHRAGWREHALEEARALVAQVPDSDLGPLMLGNLQLQYGQPREAEKTFRALVAKKPSAYAYGVLGDLAQRIGKTSEAESFFKKALQTDAKDEQAYLKLGLMAEAAGQDAKAVRYYKACVARVPNSSLAYNQLAWVYGRHKRGRQQAIRYALKAREIEPESGSVADTLGWVYYLAGDADNALKYLGEASEKLARNATVWYHLGMAQAKKGLTEKAVSSFKTSLTLNPRSENAEDMRAFLQKNQ
jgi:tetratricopeptide (TPR) repeat protein